MVQALFWPTAIGTAEPVFGQMSTPQNAKHLLLRGIDGARGEWLLLTACHNLRKLHGLVGVNGRADLAITRPGHHLTCPPQALVRSSVHPRHRVCAQGDDTLNTLTLTAE